MKTLVLSLISMAASIYATPFPQGVTAAIAPPGAIPTGCSMGYPNARFGLAVVTLAKGAVPHAAPSLKPKGNDNYPSHVSQIPDGQIQNHHPPKPHCHTCTSQQHCSTCSQASRSITPETPHVTVITEKSTIVETNHVSSVSDGQLQAPTHRVETRTITQTYTKTLTMKHGGPKPSKTKRDSGHNVDAKQTASIAARKVALSNNAGPFRGCATNSTLTLSLANGILKDAHGRTGYIASNYQFQFDGPPQAGAMFTSGFSICDGDKLALGPSTTWWQCRSGNFYNLYDRNWAPQCEPIHLHIIALDDC